MPNWEIWGGFILLAEWHYANVKGGKKFPSHQ